MQRSCSKLQFAECFANSLYIWSAFFCNLRGRSFGNLIFLVFPYQGFALQLLKSYHDHLINTQSNAIKMILLCKAGLIPLYTRAGFYLVCRSDIVHGKMTYMNVPYFDNLIHAYDPTMDKHRRLRHIARQTVRSTDTFSKIYRPKMLCSLEQVCLTKASCFIY